MATLLTDVFYEDVKKDPNLKLLSPWSPTRRFVYLTAQWDTKSPWSDPRVRKAASLAIDRQTLADVHMPGCGPIGSFAPGGRSHGGGHFLRILTIRRRRRSCSQRQDIREAFRAVSFILIMVRTGNMGSRSPIIGRRSESQSIRSYWNDPPGWPTGQVEK